MSTCDTGGGSFSGDRQVAHMRLIITNHGAMTDQEFESVAMLFFRAQTGVGELSSSVQVDHLLRCYSVDRAHRAHARAVAERARTKLQLAA